MRKISIRFRLPPSHLALIVDAHGVVLRLGDPISRHDFIRQLLDRMLTPEIVFDALRNERFRESTARYAPGTRTQRIYIHLTPDQYVKFRMMSKSAATTGRYITIQKLAKLLLLVGCQRLVDAYPGLIPDKNHNNLA